MSFAIVRNRVRDLRRWRGRWRMEAFDGAGRDRVDELIDYGADPLAGVEQRQLQLRIWRALGALPEPQREILVYRDYHDLPYAEIAELLGILLGTVMSRLHRARRALRDQLADPARETAGTVRTSGDA
ncbi:MAG: RNA polymerase sigma factor [Thermoanaerobaculia bacterium]